MLCFLCETGRIINITSVHGRFNGPRQSNYETAKHGLETVSDSLRMEMRKFGVKVIIVEPGAYGYMTSIENEDMVNTGSYIQYSCNDYNLHKTTTYALL